MRDINQTAKIDIQFLLSIIDELSKPGCNLHDLAPEDLEALSDIRTEWEDEDEAVKND